MRWVRLISKIIVLKFIGWLSFYFEDNEEFILKSTVINSKDKEQSDQIICILNQSFVIYLILFEPFMTVLKLLGINKFYKDTIHVVTRLKRHREPLDIFTAVLFVFAATIISVMILISITPTCMW